MTEDRTDLSYWFPKIKDLVLVPRTYIIKTDLDFSSLVDGITPEGFEDFCQKIAFAASRARYPAFLRTGHTSGKHLWFSTCYLHSETDIPRNVAALVEESYTADFFGLPTTTWAVREYLAAHTAFTAFNGLPIRAERRVFVNAGKVLCHHPYWPDEAIERPSRNDWSKVLYEIQKVSDEDLAEILTGSATVAQVLEGAWSLDWMYVDRNPPCWVLIDAAEAVRSFHWPDCPEA